MRSSPGELDDTFGLEPCRNVAGLARNIQMIALS